MRTGRPPVPIEQRFSTKFIIDESGCWNWQSSIDGAGYGMIATQKGVHLKAHRFSWTLSRGEIPESLFVLHRCDNRRCVNPDHLFLGTHQDNMDDMVSKGRLPPHNGEKNGASKLTEEKVLAIRSDPRSQSKIAVDYGVTQTAISKIKLRKLWSYLE